MTIEKRKPEKGLTAWQPLRDVEEVGRRFEDVFGRPFLPDRFCPESGESSLQKRWYGHLP